MSRAAEAPMTLPEHPTFLGSTPLTLPSPLLLRVKQTKLNGFHRPEVSGSMCLFEDSFFLLWKSLPL